MTPDNVANTAACQEDRAAAPLVPVGVGATILEVGVTSPFALCTPPSSVLSSAQILRMPSTTAGSSSEPASRKLVWFVRMKLGEVNQIVFAGGFEALTHQSTHWGYAARDMPLFSEGFSNPSRQRDSLLWNVSAHAHLMTLMNAPGLKMIYDRSSSQPLLHRPRRSVDPSAPNAVDLHNHILTRHSPSRSSAEQVPPLRSY